MELTYFINKWIAVVECFKDEEVKKYGLYRGNAGLAISYFVLFRYTSRKAFEYKAKVALDGIYENIASVELLNYAEGLAGIGWAIEWMVQNKFIQANTDEVLEDIDDTIYKSVLYAPDNTVSLSIGTLSKAAYFLKRYQSVNPGTHRYKNICHQECLIILTDEIEEKTAKLREVLDIDGFISQDERISSEMIDLAHSIIFLSKFLSYKINVKAVEDSLYANMNHIEKILMKLWNINQFILLSPDMQYAILLTIYAYYYSGIKLKCQYWQQKGLQYLDRILDAKSFYSDLLSANLKYFPILGRLFFYTGMERYLKIMIRALESENAEITTFNSLVGSTDLLAAIGFLDPSCICWDEVLLCS